MYFKYGSYQHPDNTVDLTQVRAQRMYSPRYRLMFTRKTMYVQGHFCVSGQSEIKDTLDAFEAAYADDWKDAGLYHDDGTRSTHFLSNSKSINGVRVAAITYPSREAEYASGRSYTITFQAEYLNIEDQITDFDETLQFIGGCGPDWELVPVPYGPPIQIVNAEQTPQRIIQRGYAVGLEAPPALPAPLLAANYEHNNLRVIERGSARKIGRHANLLFPLKYRYIFSSYTPQNFYPRPDYPGR